MTAFVGTPFKEMTDNMRVAKLLQLEESQYDSVFFGDMQVIADEFINVDNEPRNDAPQDSN